MILSALPRFTVERYAQMFADHPVPAASTFVRLTRAEAAAPDFATQLANIKAAGTKRPGTRYAGAFVLVDAIPDPDRPDAKLVAFTFVTDPPIEAEQREALARLQADAERAAVATDLANEACPKAFALEDAERITVEGFSQRFAGTDCCHFDLPWPVKPETLRPSMLAGFLNCFSWKPGCTYRGAFHLTDAEPSVTNPEASLVVFVFVKD